MNRYYVIWQEVTTQGERVTVYDRENTEPVCIIFSRYHPYAADVILKALNQIEPIIEKDAY
jgi:hypothetical protein